MRAVSYERVSSEMQLEGYSLDVQHTANLALIQARGWHHIASYRDEGISAKTTDRPAFQRMLADAHAGRFDIIVVHKLDRFSRSLTDTLLTLRDLERVNVSVVSATEKFDFSTLEGRMMLTMLATFAEWYLANLSLETTKGKRARAAGGGWNSQLAFGYTVHYKKDGGDGLPTVDEWEAEGVRRAFSLYATGQYSDATIAQQLNEGGWRPKGRGKRALALWSKDTISDLLKNRFYLGEVRYKGSWHPGQHEPIIDEELFNAVQRQRALRVRQGASAPRRSRLYLLAGLARCARCGQPLRGYSRSTPPHWHYYRDPGRDRATGCDQTTIRADLAEAEVGRWLGALRLPADWRASVQASLSEQDQGAQQTEKDRRRLQEQLKRLATLFELGDITDADYRTRRATLRAEIAALQPPPDMRHYEGVAALLEDFTTVWEAATDKERRAITHALLEAVYLDSTATGITVQIVPKPEYAALFALANKEARP